MGCAFSPDFFAIIFPQKAQELQACQRQVFAANARAKKAKARADKENARADKENARADKENARADKENARADALERILCEKTRESVYEALAVRRWFEEIPQEVTRALEDISSYARLEEVLSAVPKAKNYRAFLKALLKA